jgi:hypothetical protein
VSVPGLARARLPRAWTAHWLRAPLAAWAASRALVLALAVAGSLAFGVPERGVDPAVPGAVALLGGWDTTWYLSIARHGYEHDIGQVGEAFSNLAFFPLLPGLMALALELGLNPAVLAIVTANLAFLGALIGFRALTAGRLGERTADRATWALALLPPAVAASQAYTEGLALALAVGAALLATRGRWALAGLVAAPAALTRPTGALAAVLVALIAVHRPGPGRIRNVALALLPSALALGVFLVWMQAARGSWTLPFAAQEAWGRGGPITGLVTAAPAELAAAWDHVIHGELTAQWTSAARDLAFGALYVWLLVRLWRSEGGLRSPWVAYSALVIALPLSSGSVISLARFGLMAFPLAWPLAQWLEGDSRRPRRAAAAAVVLTALLVAQLAIRSP